MIFKIAPVAQTADCKITLEAANNAVFPKEKLFVRLVDRKFHFHFSKPNVSRPVMGPVKRTFMHMHYFNFRMRTGPTRNV
jgi:hypothetical protein